jgi:hypothetical protein
MLINYLGTLSLFFGTATDAKVVYYFAADHPINLQPGVIEKTP